MAGMQFNVQDKASVDAWIKRANELNEKADGLIKESGRALEEFGQTAEGQIFDQVVEYSGDVIQGMGSVLKGMNQILETVNKVASDIMNKIGDLVEGVRGTRGNVVG